MVVLGLSSAQTQRHVLEVVLRGTRQQHYIARAGNGSQVTQGIAFAAVDGDRVAVGDQVDAARARHPPEYGVACHVGDVVRTDLRVGVQDVSLDVHARIDRHGPVSLQPGLRGPVRAGGDLPAVDEDLPGGQPSAGTGENPGPAIDNRPGQHGLVPGEIQEARLDRTVERDGGGGGDLPVAGQDHAVAGVGHRAAAHEQVAGDGDHARGLVELQHAAGRTVRPW